MIGEYRTNTPGFTRRIARFEVEDVYVHLDYDSRFRFYIPKRWWTSERFDINVHAHEPRVQAPHLELDLGSKKISIFRPTRRFDHVSTALLVECLEFGRQVLIEA